MAAFMRQPVSPMTTIFVGFALGSGSVWPATTALVVPAGSVTSQVLTGKAEGLENCAPRLALVVLRSGSIAAATRRFIGCDAPLIAMLGQLGAAVRARATAAPPGPSSTQADSTWSLG